MLRLTVALLAFSFAISSAFAADEVGVRACTYDQFQSNENLLIFERSPDGQSVKITASHRGNTAELGTLTQAQLDSLDPNRRYARVAATTVIPVAIAAVGFFGTPLLAVLGGAAAIGGSALQYVFLVGTVATAAGSVAGTVAAVGLPTKHGITPASQHTRILIEKCVIKSAGQPKSTIQITDKAHYEFVVHNIRDMISDLNR